jgi:hypothetical protein
VPGIQPAQVDLSQSPGSRVGLYCEHADAGANYAWVTPQIVWTDITQPFVGFFTTEFDSPPGNSSFTLDSSVWTDLRSFWSRHAMS